MEAELAQAVLRESPIHIAGYACRLPGAASVSDLWTVLRERRCTIGEVGEGRWPRGRYLHPRQGEPGKAYTFRAGTLEAPWSFDPAVFGISPREAAQIDPQQRLLLELVWEALEDAGVPPSQVAGSAIGVYVGASSVDHGTRRVFDAAGSDAYYMTGSALSLIANRISYCFDFSGPSLVVDTACSSSLVALHEAVTALRAGTIDTAIVAGVNILLNPFPFIGFSAARMLSPEGLCRAFSAHGQGYVRSEGGVVMVLARDGAAVLRDGNPHARIIASGVNSDGRTVGVSLPSYEAQGRLIRTVHDSFGIDPNELAFVEAHGTGTRVGDPIEARAIGEQIGQRRKERLPIGSVKSNVGHLEPASGLVGLLKATLALRNDLLPATLHAEELNPDIPFDELNLRVAQEPVPLPRSDRPRLAAISTFGFGGTNGHVVIADPLEKRPAARSAGRRAINGHALNADAPPTLGGLLSARSEAALTDGAKRLAAVIAADEANAGDIGAALAHHRDRLSERAVVIGDLKSGLDSLASGTASDQVVRGTAIAADANVAFVFCGNGSQWAGMGRVALTNDPIFRRHFTAIDALIEREAGWSAIEMLAAEDLAERIQATSIAQPLLFALQAAATDTLRDRGLEPTIVVGHSVGEVAAAYAAGHYDRERAVRLILARSASQEFSRGTGRMAVLHVSAEDAQRFLDRIGAATIEIAAVNSPSSVTLVGPADALADMIKAAEAASLAGQMLDIDYPFHSRIMDGVRTQLHADLADLTASPGRALFISTVDAAPLDAAALDADYWWRNVRMPVLFADAIRRAAAQGAGVFIEIGPRAVLRSYLDQTLRAANATYAIVPTFSRQDKESVDALATSFATAIARGARFDATRAFGPPPASGWRHLPHYAWQRTYHLPPDTVEATGGIETTLAGTAADGLLGYRTAADVTVWHSHLDTAVMPELGDHCVAGKPWLPAAAFADMALSAAQAWLGHDRVELRDFDISRPLVLSYETAMDVRTSIDPETATCEIASRLRQSDDVWQVHVRCRVAALTGGDNPAPAAAADRAEGHVIPAADVYALASDVGLDYGPAFRRLSEVVRTSDDALHVSLDTSSGLWPRSFVLSPTDLDGVFHGLFSLVGGDGVVSGGKAFIPVRLGRVQIFQSGATVARAVISDVRVTPHALRCNLVMFDADGAVVAEVEEARFVAAALKADRDTDRVAYHFTGQRHFDVRRATTDLPDPEALRAAIASLAAPMSAPSEEAVLLLDAAAQRVAYDVLSGRAGADRHLDEAMADGTLGPALGIARQGALIAASGDGLRLVAECPIPPLDQIMPALVAEHPDFGAECALLADAAAALAEITPDTDATGTPWTPAAATWQHFRQSAPRARATGAFAQGAIAQVLEMWPADRPLRVLQLGADITAIPHARLQTLVANGRVQLVIADGDPAALQTQRSLLVSSTAAELIELNDEGLAELAQLGPFDVIVGLGALHRLDAKGLAAVHAAAAKGAVLLAVEPQSGPYNQLVLGLARGHQGRTLPVRDNVRWCSALERAGFAGVDLQVRADLGGMIVLSGIAGDTSRQASGADTSEPALLPRRARVIAVDDAVATTFATALDAATRSRSRSRGAVAPLDGATTAETAIADAILMADTGRPIDDPRRAVADTIALLKATLANADAAPARIWVVAPGGARHLVGEGVACPVATAIWSLVRTVANEYPGVDFRAVDIAATLDPAVVPARLSELVAAPGSESEIVLTAQGHVALRAASGVPGSQDVDPASCETTATCLGLVRPGSLQSLRWDVVERLAPADDEVEIEVAAAGLNFRDVMWAMGMLPAEALEDGFAGPTVGFECSGTVVRKGASVNHLAIGDHAFAMAPAALASHVTVAAAAVGRIPKTVDPAAAATVPVAFLTAHYALNRLGNLRAGDWVLIHGGAGGVGLAALQIAQAKGARIIATAGTREKRELLRHLGADHVFSSRTLAFYDEIRAVVPQGVDIVLNSLAGEAMERSLELVRPFGRFLELGKRDYYENSKIALRPFRRNVSYFGIDVDQLMQHDPRLAQDLMTELVEQLERGELHPLPHRRFDAAETLPAFRLMQQSGHIGKIVVTPPAPGEIAARPRSEPFAASPDGAHIVIGGLGGFGMATATWLADHGARTLVLVSRGGTPSADAETAIAALRARGVDVLVEACDVADADAAARLLERVRGAGHPLRSVFHCAMVIEDGALANLDRDAVERVLAPKIDGARHLDRLTRTDALDHFVLYSSATTLFGNPGQSSYVAANGYLEGLAHARAAAGLPTLAVAWGAIGDTGYLARNTRSAAILSSRTGVIAMTADEALHHLDVVMSNPARPSVVTIAPVDWQAMTRLLPVLKRPTFGALAQTGDSAGPADGAPDLAAEIDGLDAAAAQAVLARHLTQVIATIMRTAPTSVEIRRPLVDMGIDSLMTVELQLAAKERFGMELPLGALVDGATIDDLSVRLLQRMRSGVAGNEADRDFLSKHAGRPDVAPEAIAAQ
jgi:phthiocerol/phenolphthiocerol synthesis type-I polyketide synthase C